MVIFIKGSSVNHFQD